MKLILLYMQHTTHINVSHYRTLCPTHPLLCDFHLVLKAWHYIVAWQALFQLVDIFAIFVDLGAEVLEVQLLECALGMDEYGRTQSSLEERKSCLRVSVHYTVCVFRP